MSDSNDCKDYFGPFSRYLLDHSMPREQDYSKEIEELTKRIDELEKDLKMHVQGKYGILHVPTKEEIIQITKEQLIEELRRINHG